jgi:hypothetical protein
VSSEVASLEEVSLEMATQEAESQEVMDLGKATQSEYCGMARSVLRKAESSRLSCFFPNKKRELGGGELGGGEPGNGEAGGTELGGVGPAIAYKFGT